MFNCETALTLLNKMLREEASYAQRNMAAFAAAFRLFLVRLAHTFFAYDFPMMAYNSYITGRYCM